jgi:hypothetical protein
MAFTGRIAEEVIAAVLVTISEAGAVASPEVLFLAVAPRLAAAVVRRPLLGSRGNGQLVADPEPGSEREPQQRNSK